MTKTKLIALSGIDGSGKSTQIEMMKEHYESKGLSVKYLWTRGGSTNGINRLKSLIRFFAGSSLPSSGHSSKRDEMLGNYWIQRLWLITSILDLLRIYSISIRWCLARKNMVICDRYIWDTLIDFNIMFPHIDIKKWMLWKILVWFTPIPDKSILLTIPLSLSEERCLKKFDPFPDSPEVRETRYQLYVSLSKKNKWKIIDSSSSRDDVFQAIMNT